MSRRARSGCECFTREPPNKRWGVCRGSLKFPRTACIFPPFRFPKAVICCCRIRINSARIILLSRIPEDTWGQNREFLTPVSAVENSDSHVVGDDRGVRRHGLAGGAQRCEHHL